MITSAVRSRQQGQARLVGQVDVEQHQVRRRPPDAAARRRRCAPGRRHAKPRHLLDEPGMHLRPPGSRRPRPARRSSILRQHLREPCDEHGAVVVGCRGRRAGRRRPVRGRPAVPAPGRGRAGRPVPVLVDTPSWKMDSRRSSGTPSPDCRTTGHVQVPRRRRAGPARPARACASPSRAASRALSTRLPSTVVDVQRGGRPGPAPRSSSAISSATPFSAARPIFAARNAGRYGSGTVPGGSSAGGRRPRPAPGGTRRPRRGARAGAGPTACAAGWRTRAAGRAARRTARARRRAPCVSDSTSVRSRRVSTVPRSRPASGAPPGGSPPARGRPTTAKRLSTRRPRRRGPRAAARRPAGPRPAYGGPASVSSSLAASVVADGHPAVGVDGEHAFVDPVQHGLALLDQLGQLVAVRGRGSGASAGARSRPRRGRRAGRRRRPGRRRPRAYGGRAGRSRGRRTRR